MCYFLYSGISLCLVSSLTLQGTDNSKYTTRKPRITKYMTTTKDPLDDQPRVTTEEPVTVKNQPYYRVKNRGGTTCILMTSDALIEVSFFQVLVVL